MRSAVFVALVAFAVYVASLRTIVSVDASTNVLLSYSLVRDGDPFLDEFAATADRLSYWSYRVDGHDVPWYPPGTAILATPLTALGTAMGIEPPTTASVTLIGKGAASLMAAASVVFVHLAAARLAGRAIATGVAALYAFGTVTWPISAGALWTHGPAQLWVAAGLFLLLAEAPVTRARSGLVYGLAAITRPTTALLGLAAIAHLALRREWRTAALAAAWMLPALAVVLLYDLVAFGSLFSPYYGPRDAGDPILGIAGNLLSPSRGLFVYSPFLLLGAYELARASFRGGRVASVLRWQLAACVAVLLVYGSYAEWWGGYGYGNRYLAETLPVLACGLALWLRRHRRRPLARAAVVVLAVPAIAVAAIGALAYDWTGWSWERLRPAQELMWRIDLAQPWYTLTRAAAALDPVAFVGLAALAAGLVLVVGAMRRAGPVRTFGST